MPASTKSNFCIQAQWQSTECLEGTKNITAFSTMDCPYFITKSKKEVATSGGACSTGGIDKTGKWKMLLMMVSLISNFVAGVATSNFEKKDVACIGARDVVDPQQHKAPDGQVWHTFEKTDHALDYIESLYLNGTLLTGVNIYCNDDQIALEDIEVTPDDNVDVTKRWSCSSAPLGTKFTQRRVVGNDTWWTPWVKGDCAYNKDDKEVKKTITWKNSVTANISHGFDYKLAQKYAASVGIKIAKSVKRKGSQVENIGANDVLSIWSQVPVYHCEQQTQKCVRKSYAKHGCKCGHWSDKITGDLPIKTDIVNLGLSSGADAQC
ncbi:hypothetical protein KGF57_001968 [Candida theae]|uniref:Uncharacterized protein n=1 Tax=Candida theae TaxID=1198502 RepID=A0AAD5FZ98_9ASCO|nr:uncharacterized protein KGF57_001968 [Candida theae]KAI5960024.1 hypothetical protein KGF57_001968 [Candida theae]